MGLKGVAFALALVGACGAGTVEPGDSGSDPSQLAPDGAIRQFEQFANGHRVGLGCPALRWDGATAGVAQAHAEDMVRRNFFSHTNPDGQSPFDRLRAAGVTYMAAAENIAYGYTTAAGVLEAWLSSEGHRRNLENCRYTHHGVGLRNGKWVHVFIGR